MVAIMGTPAGRGLPTSFLGCRSPDVFRSFLSFFSFFPFCPFLNYEQKLYEPCLRVVSPQTLVHAAAVKAGQDGQGLLRELWADQVVGQDPEKEQMSQQAR